MKLIIDITDEQVCRDIVNGDLEPQTETDKVIVDALYRGMPYEERPQGELAEKLKDRIEESVCKYCQMNKHCELCEISRVFQIITLTAEEQKGGAE